MIQITAIVGVVTLVIGLYTGYQYATGQAAKDQVQAVKKAVDSYKADQELKEKVVIKYIEKQGKTKVVYKDRIKVVNKYVETIVNTQCLDDTGLRIYRDNLAGKSAGSSGSSGGVRPTTITGRRDSKEPAG